MSGGHFNYDQDRIGRIAEEIESLIRHNDKKDEFGYATNFSEQTLHEFWKAIKILKIAEIYAQRIDWLVSGDDGEDTFMERLKEDLVEIKVNPLDLLVKLPIAEMLHNVTRLVVINWSKDASLDKGDAGRIVDKWNCKVRLLLQDEGKTLKVFYE